MEECAQFTLSDEACCARIEFEGIVDDRSQTKGKEYGTHDIFSCGQITEAGHTYGYARHNGRTNDWYHVFEIC